MIYLYYGSDELAIQEAVARLRRRLAESDPLAELNTTELDGRGLTVGQLQAAADALPFLGERRLVIVGGLLARCNPRTGEKGGAELADALLAYLPHLPPSTRLVLVEGALEKSHAVLGWAQRQADAGGGQAGPAVRAFEAPKPAQMPAWLVARAQAYGGAIDRAAAVALTEALTRDGEVDARLADNELQKLLAYALDRPVSAADVALLVSPVSLESIFRLTDALAERNGPRAVSLLHQLLAAGEHPLALLALVTRQFRLLLHAQSLQAAGVAPAELAARLPVPPFVAQKLARQARRFSPGALEGALHRLLEMDTAIKTGRLDGQLALDLFVAGICRGERP
jgi:DNA polymerase-3 subunit delta